MESKTSSKTGAIALVIAATLLLGCPPEDDAIPDNPEQAVEPEVFDFKDYWPFQVGNVWQFSSLYVEGATLEYEVREEYVGDEVSGWGLTFRSRTKTGTQDFDRDEYVILVDDFLYHTFSKDKMHEVLDDPKNIQVGIGLSRMAPRHFIEGTYDIDEMPLYHTVAGALKSVTPFIECDGVESQAQDFPIPSDTQVVMLMDKQLCASPQDPFRSAPGFGFAKDIGMIYFYGHILSYAYVDGVEYLFEP